MPPRMAPPVRHSRSLEGLERVIPPEMPYSPTRSELFLNKPLPAKPLPDAPIEYSVMWSDSSDESESESTLDTLASPSEPRNSIESYPIFVSSGSDDFTDLVDHPPADHLLGPVRPSPLRFASDSRTDSASLASASDLSSVPTTRSEAQYGRPPQWSQTRGGTNHYFREKTWDFFPELATPAALEATGRASAGTIRSGKTRKKDSRLNLAARRYRWHSLDRAGLGVAAAGVRDSIKTYVNRTLSRDSTDAKTKNNIPRPSTAPGDDVPSVYCTSPSPNARTVQHSSADIERQFRALSTSTMSSIGTSELCESPRSIHPPRIKQLAVPMSPYQRYGTASWETPKSKKSNVRFPRYHRPSSPAGPSSPGSASVNATPPLTQPLKMQFQQNTREAVRALQGGTSHVLVALDGAKQKLIDVKDDRRREQLKSQIKFVGPVNPHTFAKTNPWV